MSRHLVPLLWHLQVILVCFCQISQTFNPSASVKQPPWCVTPDTSLGETHSYKKAQRRNTVEKYTGEIQRRNTVEKYSRETQWRNTKWRKNGVRHTLLCNAPQSIFLPRQLLKFTLKQFSCPPISPQHHTLAFVTTIWHFLSHWLTQTIFERDQLLLEYVPPRERKIADDDNCGLSVSQPPSPSQQQQRHGRGHGSRCGVTFHRAEDTKLKRSSSSSSKYAPVPIRPHFAGSTFKSFQILSTLPKIGVTLAKGRPW